MVKKEKLAEEKKEDMEKGKEDNDSKVNDKEVKKEAEGKVEPEMEKACDDEDEDLSEMNEDEKKKYKELKQKAKKKMVKSEGSLNPEESESKGSSAGNTTTPQPVIGQSQNVFVPQSGINVSREQVTPMGKSAEIDLTKSPLWNGINSKLDEMNDAFKKRLESMEKSHSDRINNMKQDMEKTAKNLEKFYNGSFYKAASDEVGPESIKKDSIKDQIEKGMVRYRNK